MARRKWAAPLCAAAFLLAQLADKDMVWAANKDGEPGLGVSDVARCVSSSSEQQSCLQDSLCPWISSPSQVCDGLVADCESGQDESRSLCESEEWEGAPCGRGEIRCSGGRPGQCYGGSKGRCDAKYDCVDRSDESGCRKDISGLFISSGLSEEAAENAGKWAAAFVLIGLPLTWLAKHLCMRFFISWFGRKKEYSPSDPVLRKRDHEEESALSSDEDVILMLEFICAMVARVEETGHAFVDFNDNAGEVTVDGEEKSKDEEIYELFSRVHSTAAWSENARIVFDMGHLLFDSRMDLVDEFHVAMNEMEKRFHGGENLDMNLSLKHDLGNKMVDELRWSTEPPGIRKLQKMLPTAVQNMMRTVWFKAALVYLGLLLDAIGYYFDFVKDWVIFAILFKTIDKSSFYRFEVQLVLLLFIFLIFPELIRGAYFATNFKLVLGVTEYSFKKFPQTCLKLVLVFFSPFIPAVLLWERGSLYFQSLKVQGALDDRIETCMQSPRETMDKKLIRAFKEDFREYHETLTEGDRLLRVVTDAKYLEASTETIFQYVLQLLVVLVVTADSPTVSVTPGLESLFFDGGVGALLYLSLVLSFVSLCNTRVGVEKKSKFGLFKTTAKIQFGLHSALALATKVFCVVFYFAPSLGLFGLSSHYEASVLPFASPDLIVDVSSSTAGPNVTTVSQVWPSGLGTDYEEEYTLANLPTLYVFFVFFVPFLCVGLYILKWNLIPSFSLSRSLSSRLLHVVSCLAFPSVFRDWDDKRTEDVAAYEQRWQRVRWEHGVMSLWHLASNLTLIVPLLYSCVRVIQRGREVSAAGFSATEEESEAEVAAWTMAVAVPPALVAAAALEWRLVEWYYRSGHPWNRILVEFPSEKERKKKKEEEVLVL